MSGFIMSDLPLEFTPDSHPEWVYVDLSRQNITPCTGCFGCWVKTPGRCVIRDDAVQIYPIIARSDRLIYVTHVQYGSYDIPMKTMLERAIPIQQAFIRLHHGETHHVQRRVREKDALIIAYGAVSEEEQALFRRLIERNAHNMLFRSVRVCFAAQSELNHIVNREVQAWEA